MRDDRHRFDIVLACSPHRAKKVGENVAAPSLLSYAPDIGTALHRRTMPL
jgi:hypothetical protein